MPQRPSKLAEQRARLKRARQPNPWATASCAPSLTQEELDYIEWRMHVHDNVEPIWRALIHHYGYEIAAALHESNVEPLVAHGILEDLRKERQKLYDVPMMRSFGRRHSRTNES